MAQSDLFFLPLNEKEDIAYKNIRDGGSDGAIQWRECSEELWKIFGPYANAQFREKAQEQFFPFWWEMFLGVTFLENGFNLEKTEIDQPDICIKDKDSLIWVEATMPQHGEGADRVLERRTIKEVGMAQLVPNEQIILRYTSVARDKNINYKERLERGIIKEADPYVIAIHGYCLKDTPPHEGIPLIVKALYPVGDLTVTFSKHHTETETFYITREVIFKKNKTGIGTSVFLKEGKDDYNGISGVLFSHKAPAHWTTVPPQRDFIFIHNYLARNPISLGSIKFAEEYYIQEKDDDLILKPFYKPEDELPDQKKKTS